MKNMNWKEKTQLIQDSALQGVAELHVRSLETASKVGEMSARAKTQLTVAACLLLFAMNSGIAIAAGGDCGGEAGSKLAGFISKIASFLMLLGGAAALLMFAVGALFIIAGGNQSRVSKGIGYIKNAAIGLGVLVVGGFIKVVVVNLAKGGTENNGFDASCVGEDSGVPTR